MAHDSNAGGADRRWSLLELLSVPYLVHASTIEAASGAWLRRASYPELPGCDAEAPTIEEALRLLERRRIEIIIDAVRTGGRLPVPRPPLSGCDPQAIAAETGLQHKLAAALARDADELRE